MELVMILPLWQYLPYDQLEEQMAALPTTTGPIS